MALPAIKRVSREELKGSPDWIEPLLYAINLFMGAVYALLNRGLTFQENIRCVIAERRFTTPADYDTGTFEEFRFSTGLKNKTIGVQVLQIVALDDTPIVNAPGIIWEEINGEIRVNRITGLENSTRYTARLMAF